MVKIKRTFPAPLSLAVEYKKENGSYAQDDVIKQLQTDFNGKCYICEMKNLSDPQIEHLLPHKQGKDKKRKFDWENLFWACPHCNRVKNQKKYEEGILDCCKIDPEEFLFFRLNEKYTEVGIKMENIAAERTAELINEVFNLQNTGMRIYASAFRLQELQKEMNVFYDKLESFKKNRNSVVARRTLKALLKRESQFAAFKRCYIQEHAKEYPELLPYIK